jgi:hypothetical protein
MKFFTLPSPWFQRWHWHRRKCFRGVNYTAEIVSAVSMTPLKLEYNRFSQRKRSHMRNGFRALIRAIGGIVWWKKTRVESCYSPFKGAVAQDFRPLVFFHQSTPYMSLINRIKLFCTWHRIRRDNHFESRQMRSRQPPTFFCFKYLYGMGIFDIKIFLLDFPFNRRKRTCKVCLRFQLRHRNFSGVNDTAKIVSAVSLKPLKPFQRCHRWNRFSTVNDTADIVSAVSMTLLK